MDIDANTELSYLEQFFQNDGSNIYNEVKARFSQNDALCNRIEAFSQKYIDDMTSDDIKNSLYSNGQYNGVFQSTVFDPQTYLKATTFNV